MHKPMRVAIRLLAPVLGVTFFALWTVAEAGRSPLNLPVFAVLGLAIALAGSVPVASLAMLILTEIAVFLGILAPPSSTDWPSYLAIVFVVVLVAARARPVMRLVALGIGVVAGIGAVALMTLAPDNWVMWTGGNSLWFGAQGSPLSPVWQSFVSLSIAATILVAFGWLIGVAVNIGLRLRLGERVQLLLRSQVERTAEELARSAERTRIAQEMHDVLAHSLAVIVAQADGARYLRTKRPAAVDGALMAIADSAREALLDVNGIIDGMFDGVAPPQPGLADLDELVAGVRAAGLDVQRTEAGERGELAAGQQLAVYRVLQEGFTNALRHRGRGSALSVVLDWRGPGLSLQLVSSGTGDVAAPVGEKRSGRGLDGMRERARLAGGWLAAGLDENGDHRITAFVPYRTAPATVGRLVAA